MFVVLMNYIKPLDVVDEYLAEHRNYLEQGYQKNCFVASGPRNPRTGGIIISQLKDKQELEALLKQDPFVVKGIANYEIIDFNPVKYHTEFASFI